MYDVIIILEYKSAIIMDQTLKILLLFCCF